MFHSPVGVGAVTKSRVGDSQTKTLLFLAEGIVQNWFVLSSRPRWTKSKLFATSAACIIAQQHSA